MHAAAKITILNKYDNKARRIKHFKENKREEKQFRSDKTTLYGDSHEFATKWFNHYVCRRNHNEFDEMNLRISRIVISVCFCLSLIFFSIFLSFFICGGFVSFGANWITNRTEKNSKLFCSMKFVGKKVEPILLSIFAINSHGIGYLARTNGRNGWTQSNNRKAIN